MTLATTDAIAPDITAHKDHVTFQALTRDQEAALASRIRSGDREAVDRLVEANMRFVIAVARGYSRRGMPFEDLVAEGSVGIVLAALRFEPARGTRFVTYAAWWIRKAILAALGEKSRLVRLPDGQVRRMLRHAGSSVAGSPPRTAGAHRRGRARPAAVSPPLHDDSPWKWREMSLSDVTAGTESRTVLDWLTSSDPSAEQELIEADRSRKLRRALERLTRQERDVLAFRFGLDDRPVLTLREVGRAMDLSNERVRQIELRAKARLAVLMRREDRGAAPLSISAGRVPRARPGRGSGRPRPAASTPGTA